MARLRPNFGCNQPFRKFVGRLPTESVRLRPNFGCNRTYPKSVGRSPTVTDRRSVGRLRPTDRTSTHATKSTYGYPNWTNMMPETGWSTQNNGKHYTVGSLVTLYRLDIWWEDVIRWDISRTVQERSSKDQIPSPKSLRAHLEWWQGDTSLGWGNRDTRVKKRKQAHNS